MSLHAFVRDNEVVKVEECDDDSYHRQSPSYQLIIDVQNLTPVPEVGWVLSGNQLVPMSQSYSQDELDLIQQTSQRKFGVSLISIATDKIGARNFKLARDGTPANVPLLVSQMNTVKLLLEGGALKTVRSLITSIKSQHTAHEDILDETIADITSFLQSNGWN